MRNFHKFGKENISAAEMEKERERLRKQRSNATLPLPSLKSEKTKKEHKPSDFKLGESVKVLSMNLTGTVTSLPDAKGNVTVQMGILFPGQYFRSWRSSKKQSSFTAKKMQSTPKARSRWANPSPSVLRSICLGKTVDEAVAELDKYLDDASRTLYTVRVVHGKGTGAFRKGIHEYLRRQKHVKSFRLAHLEKAMPV